jgi:hypothetical protein
MQSQGKKPRSVAGAVMIVALWLGISLAAWFWLAPYFR